MADGGATSFVRVITDADAVDAADTPGTRSARDRHLAVLDHPHAAPLVIAARTAADVLADRPTAHRRLGCCRHSFGARPIGDLDTGGNDRLDGGRQIDSLNGDG